MKWTQYAVHSSWQQLPNTFDSFKIFNYFLDLFYILGSPQHTYQLLLLHCPHVPSLLVLSGFTECASTSPFSSQRAVPAEDHCLRLEGPLIAGLGTCGGVHQINSTNSNIWFPLCLMKMLAFHVQPNRLDQICSIDLDARAARAQATHLHVPQYSTHYTNTRRYKLSKTP